MAANVSVDVWCKGHPTWINVTVDDRLLTLSLEDATRLILELKQAIIHTSARATSDEERELAANIIKAGV